VNELLCPICNSSYTELDIEGISSVYDRTRYYSINRCRDCGVRYTSPIPSEADLREIYEHTYAYELHDLVSAERKIRARKLMALTETYLRDKKMIIEIGTGAGILLSEIKNSYECLVLGCEISQDATDKANRTLGKNLVVCKDATSFLTETESRPNVVILSHTLEHFKDPKEILGLIHRSLVEGGTVIIVVPNVSGAPTGRMRKFWGYWQVPVHITHFDRHSLSKLLNSLGFHVTYSNTRSADFLSLGLLVSNIFGLRSRDIPLGGMMKVAIKSMSWLWAFMYHFGKSDLIIVAQKKT